MKTQTENVVCIYNEHDALVALIKRDEITGKKLVHMAQEASVEDIAVLINPNHMQI